MADEIRERGRPPADITLEEMKRLGMLHCTIAEMAGWFNVCTSTIENYLAKPEYREAYDKGRAEGKQSLRRAQLQAAIEDLNPTMLVWMGKQLLGQTDVSKTDNVHKTIDANGNEVGIRAASKEEIQEALKEYGLPTKVYDT